MNNFLEFDGSLASISMKVHRSFISCLNTYFFPSTTIWGFPGIALFIDSKNLVDVALLSLSGEIFQLLFVNS